MKVKLIRITTVPISLKVLLKGQLNFMTRNGLHVIGVSSSGEELEEVGKNEKISFFPINMSRKITPFKDFKSLLEMYFFLRNEKPLIVHTHTPKAGLIGMLAAKLARVPFRLHTVAGMPLMEATGAKRAVLDLVEKVTYWAANKVYPNSKGLYSFILENNFTSKDKLKVIGNGSSNGIDTSFFSVDEISNETQNDLKAELKISENDFIFIFVGRLVGDKGINELIKAFSSNSLDNCKLLLVGSLESDLDPLEKDTLLEIENNKNIIWVGFQKDVRKYFAISNALVFPSYREGFPNVVMQAGAMGLPSIVSNINGCNEIIIDGENGIIIPVKDSQAIFLAMIKLRNDFNLYNKMKYNSRKLIKERYEQKVVWESILSEYNSLINK